jgi:hypothetical protein
MTTVSAFGDSDPHQRLSQARELARQVRRTQRATWFPLLVFALVTLAAIPVHRAGHPAGTICRTVRDAGRLPLYTCVAHNSATYVYWPVALVLSYVVIAAFYVHQSRARGVGSRIRPYVIAGLAISGVVTAASIWSAHHPPIGQVDILGWHAQGVDLYRFLGPAGAIGFGLLVLAFVERNLALFAVTVGYLVIALAPVDFGWAIAPPSRWAFVPQTTIDGGVLLAAAIAFALVQRPLRRSSR